MSNVYHIGDLHLGHRNIIKYRSMFKGKSVKEHDSTVVDIVCSNISRRDTLYLHGDIFFSQQSVEDFAQVLKDACNNIHLILGNHDFERMSAGLKIKLMQQLIDLGYNIHGFHKNKKVFLSHAPIHVDELRGKFNIHGHVHLATINDSRYANVSWDNCEDGKPVNRQLLNEYFMSEVVFGDV